MKQYGVPPEHLWPYKVPNEDIAPTKDSYDAAAASKLWKYDHVTPAEVSEYITKIKTVVASELPVIVGMNTGRRFWNLRGPLDQHNYGPVNESDNRPSTSHAVVIVGYSDTLSGGSFIIANSLGPSWGFQGYGALPYKCAVDIGEAWVMRNFAGAGK